VIFAQLLSAKNQLEGRSLDKAACVYFSTIFSKLLHSAPSVSSTKGYLCHAHPKLVEKVDYRRIKGELFDTSYSHIVQVFLLVFKMERISYLSD